MYPDNIPLAYALATSRLDTTGQRWVAQLATYNFKVCYKTGKSNIKANVLSNIEWTHVIHLEAVKAILNTGLEGLGVFTEVYACRTTVCSPLVVKGPPPNKMTPQHWLNRVIQC